MDMDVISLDADTGALWHNAMGDAIDLIAVMESAGARTFVDIDAFKDAAAQLTQLISASGRRYPVIRVLSREGGESLVLKCSDPNGRDVVAKVYFRPVESEGSSIEARSQVLHFMATPEGKKYTLAVSDVGTVELNGGKYFFEMMPFCPQGDMTPTEPMPFDKLVALTAYLNEALHSMHSAGILHRDLKPANLYRLEGRVVLADFGVAKMAGRGATTITVGTDGFRPPESLMALSAGDAAFVFDETCDYYSLGVTLGCLFEGRFVYEGMSAGEMTMAVRDSRLPLRRQDPHREQLENLLKGLCRYDSNYRFTYEDVRRWLVDHDYTGGVTKSQWDKPMLVFKEEFRDRKSLFFAITRDAARWDEGKELLYGKHFENFFKSFNTDLSRAAQRADEKWRRTDPDKGLALFLKELYAPGPLVWKGDTYKSLEALGESLLETRAARSRSEILQKGIVSNWLDETQGIQVQEDTRSLTRQIEALSQQQPEACCYWFGNSFSGRHSVRICGKQASDMSGLISIMFADPTNFYRREGIEHLTDRGVGGSLYGFLYSLGYQELVEKEWKHAQDCDDFNKVCVLLSMLDNIATQEKADAAPLRRFFRDFGPMGIVSYTKKLLEEMGDDVYFGVDSEGKRCLKELKNMQLPGYGPVEQQYREMLPLAEKVEKLRGLLMDDPFCFACGAYEPRGVLCKDLRGCFAYRVFGRPAPLGFQSKIGV